MRNARLGRRHLDRLPWGEGVVQMLEGAMKHSALTARGWDRVRRVAATIADLDESDVVAELHVAEALAYRGQR
jgi:magnesium chelatase family protein